MVWAPLAVTVIGGSKFITVLCVVTQPFASVISTEYGPAARPEILLLVAPVDHTREVIAIPLIPLLIQMLEVFVPLLIM